MCGNSHVRLFTHTAGLGKMILAEKLRELQETIKIVLLQPVFIRDRLFFENVNCILSIFEFFL